MKFPQDLEVIITSAHLARPAKTDIIELAVAEALARAGLAYERILVRTDDLIVYIRKPGVIVDVNAARYLIPDDLWKAKARHSAGRRVKPGSFTLNAIYLDRDHQTMR